jgi:hypothetical protein
MSLPGSPYDRGSRKASGNKEATVHSAPNPESQQDRTTASGRINSLMNWRQAPQGGQGRSPDEYTTSACRPSAPASTAAASAFRSAQVVSPSEAFSTLHPE